MYPMFIKQCYRAVYIDHTVIPQYANGATLLFFLDFFFVRHILLSGETEDILKDV